MMESLYRKEAVESAASARDIHEPLREEKPGLSSWLVAAAVFLAGFFAYLFLLS